VAAASRPLLGELEQPLVAAAMSSSHPAPGYSQRGFINVIVLNIHPKINDNDIILASFENAMEVIILLYFSLSRGKLFLCS